MIVKKKKDSWEVKHHENMNKYVLENGKKVTDLAKFFLKKMN